MILLVPTLVSGFGSFQDQKYVELVSGDSATLRIFFFNIHDEPVKIDVSLVKVPGYWNVSIKPKILLLNRSKTDTISSEDKHYLYIGGKYIEAEKVDINVEIPWDTEKGDYEIIVEAKTSPAGQGTLKVAQRRVFNFDVEVMGLEERISKTEEPQTFDLFKIGRDIIKPLQEIPSTGLFVLSPSNIFLFFFLFGLFIFGYFLFKRRKL